MKFLRYDDMYDNDILWKIKMLKKKISKPWKQIDIILPDLKNYATLKSILMRKFKSQVLSIKHAT